MVALDDLTVEPEFSERKIFDSNEFCEMRFSDTDTNININNRHIADYNLRVLATLSAVYIPDKYINLRQRYYEAAAVFNPYRNPDLMMRLFFLATEAYNQYGTVTQLKTPIYGRKKTNFARVFESTDMYQCTDLFDLALSYIYDTIMSMAKSKTKNKYEIFDIVLPYCIEKWATCLAAKARLLSIHRDDRKKTDVGKPYNHHDVQTSRLLITQVQEPFQWLRGMLAANTLSIT